MSAPDRFLLIAVRDAIAAVHRAFGAPGDYGYGTPKGDALFELYKQRAAIADAIEAGEQRSPEAQKELRLASITSVDIRAARLRFSADETRDGHAGGGGRDLGMAEGFDLVAEEVTPARCGVVGLALQCDGHEPLDHSVSAETASGLHQEFVGGSGHVGLPRCDEPETNR